MAEYVPTGLLFMVEGVADQYEPRMLVGIFSTEERANQAVEESKRKYSVCDFEVSEIELDRNMVK